MKKYDLVKVDWVDSVMGSGWQWLSEMRKPKPIVCSTVGWLVEDGKDCKCLVQSIGDYQEDIEDMQLCGKAIIPCECIKKITKIIEVVETENGA